MEDYLVSLWELGGLKKKIAMHVSGTENGFPEICFRDM